MSTNTKLETSSKTPSPRNFNRRSCGIPMLLLVALLALFVSFAAASPVVGIDTVPEHYDCCIIGSDCVQSPSCTTQNCYCDVLRGTLQAIAMPRSSLRSTPPPPKYDGCTVNHQCVRSDLCKGFDCLCS